MTPKADEKRERETAIDRLLRAHRERGDARAGERVVQLYLPLVDAFARRYEHAGGNYDDLMRAGSAVLTDAVRRYLPRYGDFLEFVLPIIATETGARVGPDSAEAASDFDLRASRVQLADAFRALDEAESAVVHLLFVEAVDGERAAQRLGMSDAEFHRHRDTALAKIRGHLERPDADRVEAVRSARRKVGEEPPAAAAKTGHSGRLLLRMPQSLHTELAEAAEREEVSLNQFITNTLAAAMGWPRGAGPPDAEGSSPSTSAPRWLPVAIVANIIVLVLAGIVALVLLLAG